MSRGKILASIRKHKPEAVEKKTLPKKVMSNPLKMISAFRESLEKAGGVSYLVKDIAEIKEGIQKHYPDRKKTYSQLVGIIDDSIDVESFEKPHQLNDLDLAILKGDFGVAENGAVWLSDTDLKFRATVFITQQLVLVIDRKDIVEDMHQAYARLSVQELCFGCFVAGPSKTADIEQALVIGAHGARGLIVYIVER